MHKCTLKIVQSIFSNHYIESQPDFTMMDGKVRKPDKEESKKLPISYNRLCTWILLDK